MSDKAREAFEAAARECKGCHYGYSFNRDNTYPDRYSDHHLQKEWMEWLFHYRLIQAATKGQDDE